MSTPCRGAEDSGCLLDAQGPFSPKCLSFKELLEVPAPWDSGTAASTLPGRIPEAFGGSSAFPSAGFPRQLRGSVWLLCVSGPGREPCLNVHGSESLARVWVSPTEDNSVPSNSEHSGTQAASQGPLHSGILRSNLNPPLWPLTALPGLPSPKLLASSESHTPKRPKGPG